VEEVDDGFERGHPCRMSGEEVKKLAFANSFDLGILVKTGGSDAREKKDPICDM
jgi:hypothetical protein